MIKKCQYRLSKKEVKKIFEATPDRKLKKTTFAVYKFKYTKPSGVKADIIELKGFDGDSTWVEKTNWTGYKCSKEINIKAGEPHLCKNHQNFRKTWISEKDAKKRFIESTKSKSRPQSTQSILNSILPKLLNEKTMPLIFILPPIIIFIFLTQLPMTYSETLVGNSWNYEEGATKYLVETGRDKEWQYPNLLRLVITIMLSLPIYTIFFNLIDGKSWPTSVFKAIMYFLFGIPILLIIYFFIAFWLSVFGL